MSSSDLLDETYGNGSLFGWPAERVAHEREIEQNTALNSTPTFTGQFRFLVRTHLKPGTRIVREG